MSRLIGYQVSSPNFFFFLAVLKFELRALCLHPQPFSYFSHRFLSFFAQAGWILILLPIAFHIAGAYWLGLTNCPCTEIFLIPPHEQLGLQVCTTHTLPKFLPLKKFWMASVGLPLWAPKIEPSRIHLNDPSLVCTYE
jgi:hypothetical protein